MVFISCDHTVRLKSDGTVSLEHDDDGYQDELAYSNMLGHFFVTDGDRFRKFSEEVLDVQLRGNYSVKREYKNIDILVENEEKIIVIENKIKSGINGIRHDVYGDVIQTQLDKYYETVSKPDFAKGRQISCFIFSPDYNPIDEKRFKCKRDYRVIKYGQLHSFFSEEEYKRSSDKYYWNF